MFQKIAKHRANDASNDVHRPPLGYRGILPKIPLNLTSEGLKYPQEVRVQHETCSTICGTPVQAILDQKNLTELAGGVKEGLNMAQNGPRFYIFFASEPSRGP